MKKMFRIIAVALIAAMFIPAFQSCKKGENDPAISLKSRTSRLTGDWEVSKATMKDMSGGTIDTYTYSDGTIVATFSGGSSVTGTYTWKITIEKDGTYKTERTEIVSGTSYTEKEEGRWYFLDKNKDNDVKAKEWIVMQVTNRTTMYGSTINTYTYEGDNFTYYSIDQLKSKEVVMKQEYKYTGSGSTSSYEVEMTLSAE
jgi:hypothetical protein